MKPRAPYALPSQQDALVRRAVRLQITSLVLMSSVIGSMAVVMGSSQAMRTAWFEDTLSLVPPIAFLIAVRVRRRTPNDRWPYGYHRAVSVSFLVAATTLAAFGILLVSDAVSSLVRAEHPTIGYVTLFGEQVWQGWLMIATLVYSIVPPLVLGRLKLPIARELHAKVLLADAKMNKADWMTGGAAALGVLGIGFGYWWADATAALAISWSVLADGIRSLRTAVADLMDRAARPVDEHEQFDLPARLDAFFRALPWVREHAIRLREEGDVCVGEAFIVVTDDAQLSERVAQAARDARALDWRLYDLVIMPVPSLEPADHNDDRGRARGHAD
jgi:cation diffusion facilitator family transporter